LWFVLNCSFKTGLIVQIGLGSSANKSRASYGSMRGQRNRLEQMRLGASPEQVARAVCGKNDLSGQNCTDPLLLALTPSSYSSNSTADTPGGRAFISPAQVRHCCEVGEVEVLQDVITTTGGHCTPTVISTGGHHAK
jgi:hypothetical protein